MEVDDLLANLLRRLDALGDASRTWRQKRDQLDQQELKAYYHFDREGFAETLRDQTQEQGMFFDRVEALLAAWARLSLLLFPLDGRDENADFRRERGKAVRRRLAVGDDSVFGIGTFAIRGCTLTSVSTTRSFTKRVYPGFPTLKL